MQMSAPVLLETSVTDWFEQGFFSRVRKEVSNILEEVLVLTTAEERKTGESENDDLKAEVTLKSQKQEYYCGWDAKILTLQPSSKTSVRFSMKESGTFQIISVTSFANRQDYAAVFAALVVFKSLLFQLILPNAFRKMVPLVEDQNVQTITQFPFRLVNFHNYEPSSTCLCRRRTIS